MKNGSFSTITVVAITCIICVSSCGNSTHKVRTQNNPTIQLKDSVISSVYLGLQLGTHKDSVLLSMQELENNGVINNLKKDTIDVKVYSVYQCADIDTLFNTYSFNSKINVKIDSIYKPINVFGFVDFYKDSLYMVVFSAHCDPSKNEDTALKHMYSEHYGNIYSESSKYVLSELSFTKIYTYDHSIKSLCSYDSDNCIWTSSNAEITIADITQRWMVEEYEESSFERVYNEFHGDYMKWDNPEQLARYISLRATSVNEERELLKGNIIVAYKDIKLLQSLRTKINEDKQRKIDAKNKLIRAEDRKKEIADSILNEKNRIDYLNQKI